MEELAEVLKENEKLKERIQELELLLKRKNGSSTRAYDEIRAMIINKVNKVVIMPEQLLDWQKKDTRQRAERQIMSDLKWDLRVRRIQDFRDEHIEKAKEYIGNYTLSEELKKSRWSEEKC